MRGCDVLPYSGARFRSYELSHISRARDCADPDNLTAIAHRQASSPPFVLVRVLMGMRFDSLEVRGPDDFDIAFEAARGLHPDALITVEDPLTLVVAHGVIPEDESSGAAPMALRSAN